MKGLIAKLIGAETCGSIVTFTSLTILFFIGLNYMELIIPETILVAAITILLTFGLIAFFAKIYWIFYFWSQFTTTRKYGEILKIAFYTLLLSVAAFPTINTFYLLGLK